MNSIRLLIIVVILNENKNTLIELQKRVGKELYKIQDSTIVVIIVILVSFEKVFVIFIT